MTLHFLASSACAYLTAEAWPISKPVPRLAGIRRLERNARRWRLRISRWIYEVTGPRYALKLLRYPRRNQVAPDFFAAKELSHRWGAAVCIATPSLRRAFSRLDHDQLVFPRVVLAPEGCGIPILLRVEAGDALLEGRELDDDEAVEFLGAFEGLVTPAARQHLRAVLVEDRGHAVRGLPGFHGILGCGAGYPIGRHGFLLMRAGPGFRGGGRSPHRHPRCRDRRPRRDSPSRRRQRASPPRGRLAHRAGRRRCTRRPPAAARGATRRAGAEPDAA